MKRTLQVILAILLVAISTSCSAATNPFADVPASHWAYDAISQLAARGVISGYPDGSFKGSQPSTRYELASVIARSLAKVDAEKASQQDIEMLKRLVVEFRDELTTLGVKNEGIEERIGVLDKDLGGWSLSGWLRFDADFGQDTTKGFYEQTTGSGSSRSFHGENQFDLNHFSIFLRKRIDENTMFETWFAHQPDATGGALMKYNFYHIITKLPHDITLDIGHILFEGEKEIGYGMAFDADDDSVLGNFFMDAIVLSKELSNANFKLLVGRLNDQNAAGAFVDEDGVGQFVRATSYASPLEQFFIYGRAEIIPNEHLRAGILAYYLTPDEEVPNVDNTGIESDSDLLTLGAYAGYSFVPGVELKGIYYHQSQGDSWKWNAESADDASLWRAILEINQDVLKFTSLHLEYGQWDNNFFRFGQGFHFNGANLTYNTPQNDKAGTIWGVRAEQRWSDKWSTVERYFKAGFDTPGYDDTSTYSLAVTYHLNPGMSFELAYDAIDYGTGNTYDGARNGEDGVFRFRTLVFF
jgi:hypothetical protein